MKVLTIVGTRPEAIKLAPILRELSARDDRFETVLISSGQHREMLDQVFDLLDLAPDYDLALMSPRQQLAELTARLISGLAGVMRAERPDAVLVQGDTTTCLCGALSAFYERIPVGHVEAGLRSGVADNPFPEEANRCMVTRLARWHFAPTKGAVENLRAEGVPDTDIELTGNTVVDSLRWMLQQGAGDSAFRLGLPRKVLVTLHRRESQSDALHGLAWVIARIADRPGVEVVLPLHRSPNVREALIPTLVGHQAVRLVEPLDYAAFIATLADADLVLTDSGGVQEEAATIGKPMLVLRETTERPEAVAAGGARLVGVDPARVLREAYDLLDSLDRVDSAATSASPFGDGHASRRIVERLADDLSAAGHPDRRAGSPARPESAENPIHSR